MDSSIPVAGQDPVNIVDAIIQHPYIFLTFIFTLCCIVTRIKTGLQARYNNLDTPEGTPREIPVLPYWVPWLGHTVPFGIWFEKYFKKTAYSTPSSIYTLKVMGGNHHIVTSPGLMREIFNKPNQPIDIAAFQWRFLKLGFGDRGAFEEWNNRNPEEVASLHKIILNLMKDPYLGEGISRIVALAEKHSWSLISGTPSWVDHSVWERAGNVEIVSSASKEKDFVAEVDLFNLLRNYIGHVATETLMGHQFLENNPDALNDIWIHDNKLLNLMMGLPTWMTPSVFPALGARQRLTEAVAEHHKALMDIMDGKDPGSRYSDLSDVSGFIYDRVKGFHKYKSDRHTYGVGNMVMLWALNVNANPMTFWVIFYIYSRPELLARIRDEIKPYVTLHRPDSDGLPISEAPRLKIDIENLMTKCPILKGAFFEAMRLEVGSVGYRLVTDDFVLNESKDDALKLGKARPDKYIVRKGDLICFPVQVQHSHPMFYNNPEEFDASRFWVKRQDEKGEEQISVEYGTIRPWGGGKTMCKGRPFAEREVCSFLAGIVTLWEIEPVAKEGWKHPGNVQTAGTCNPAKDIRVRMWRRKL